MIRRLAMLAVVAALAAPSACSAAGPDPVNQPLRDGCQRNPVGLLSYTSPEWAFVGGRSAGDPVRVMEGAATLAHTADEDLPEGHDSYDLDWDVIPASGYQSLLAGDPNANGGQGNGNWANDADRGKLHVEWESGSVPTFAWPTEGDHVKLWGQWVWDCGHWGQGIDTNAGDRQQALIGTGDYLLPGQVEGPSPGGLRGEQTELHPLQAIVVTRGASYRASAAERETDAFIANDGTHAYAEEQCGQRAQQIPNLPSYGPDFSACSNSSANRQQPIAGRTYEFSVPAPPKPSAAATLRYREVKMVDGHGASEQITPTATGLDVRVTFARQAGPLGFGASYFVGWDAPAQPLPDELQLDLHSVTVNHSLAEPNQDHPTVAGAPAVGIYNLYINLNGYWNFIGGNALGGDQWAPGLAHVSDGTRLAVNRSVDFFVPSGHGVRLDISGRECDLPRMDPCIATPEVADANDHPGEAIATFPSAPAALGDHVLKSPVKDNYELSYSIRRVSGLPPTPPGTTGVATSAPGGDLRGEGTVIALPANAVCASASAPRTRVRSVHASRRGVRVRGSASARGCHARVTRTEVAIAKLAGRRCRFLDRDRDFHRAVSCAAPRFLRLARGHWRFAIRARLPRGRYLLFVRSVDSFGDVEVHRTRVNTVRFSVR